MRKPFALGVPILLLVTLMLSLTLLPTTLAQDATPTPIPILPDETDDSAAPLAPEIAPPNPDSAEPIAESTLEVVPTAIGGGDSVTSDVPALAGNTCPVGVSDSFTAAEILCETIGGGEACIGNGTVEATFNGDVDGTFSQASDIVQLTSLERIQLISDTTWTVIRFTPQLKTTDGGDLATATVFAYGNLTLTDTGRVAEGGARSGTVIAQRGMNVRRAPGAEGVVVWQLQGGDQVTVTGITADREWVRIIIPNEFAGTGWVYAPYMEVDGGAETLGVVTTNSPVPDLTPPQFAPGQSYEFRSDGLENDCGDNIPMSGLLMQSPNGTPDSLRIQFNQAEVQFSGTIFVEALIGDVLRVSVLEGQATAIANSNRATATANNRINVPLDANLVVNGAPQSEAFDASDLANVAIRLLPRTISFGQEDAVEIVSVESSDDTEDETDTTDNTGFGTPVPTEAPATCTLTAPDEVRNIRAGTSTDFEIVDTLEANQSIDGVGQAIGQLNLTWYQTVDGGWLRIDTIEASSGCGSVPVVEAPDLPEPTVAPTEAVTFGLSSSVMPELVCDSGSITGSATSDGTETSIAIGGKWTGNVGTTVTFTTQGGLLRPEFGAYIKLIADDGTELASSGEGRSLTITLDRTVTFEARFSAANGDTVVMAASCSASPG